MHGVMLAAVQAMYDTASVAVRVGCRQGPELQSFTGSPRAALSALLCLAPWRTVSSYQGVSYKLWCKQKALLWRMMLRCQIWGMPVISAWSLPLLRLTTPD